MSKFLFDAFRHILDSCRKSELVAFQNHMPFLLPNIDTKGRVIRALGALILGIAAPLTWPHSSVAAIALGASSAFMAFEAARGWCVARACGVKTKF
jgi:hypothetical protein